MNRYDPTRVCCVLNAVARCCIPTTNTLVCDSPSFSPLLPLLSFFLSFFLSSLRYQLRLKDMDYNEKIKEVTEKFTQELEQDRHKYDLLSEEKDDMKLGYEEKTDALGK